jgi:recombination protein RecR
LNGYDRIDSCRRTSRFVLTKSANTEGEEVTRLPAPLENLIEELVKLPTIGRKSAERLAFYMLRAEKPQVLGLADAIRAMKESISSCPQCFNVTGSGLCAICSDASRDKETICVVESPMDVMSIERSRTYRGLYHVLQGRLSPLSGITADDLRIRELVERIKKSRVEEVILATSFDVEGDATALYISSLLREIGVTVSRIGLGVPMGSSLEYADEMTLAKALEGRKKITTDKEKKS